MVGPGPLFGARFPNGAAILAGPPQNLVDVSAIADPRNCMPSLHVGWALLVYWHARTLGTAARMGGAFWLASTILATLAMGQHYFIDLVVAVPFAALIDALAAGVAPRRKSSARGPLIATASVLLAVWYAILLLAPPGTVGRVAAAAAGAGDDRRQLGAARALVRSALKWVPRPDVVRRARSRPGRVLRGDLARDLGVQLGPQDHDVGRQQEPGEDRDDHSQRAVDPVGLGVVDANQEKIADPASHSAVAASEPAETQRRRAGACAGPKRYATLKPEEDHHRQHWPAQPADQPLPELRQLEERKDHGQDDHRRDGDRPPRRWRPS